MPPTRPRIADVAAIGVAIVASMVAFEGPDAHAQSTTRVSVNSNGIGGNRWSGNTSISADGRFVVFASECRNFAAIDGNDASDVFVRDRLTGVTECVSVDPNGATGDAESGNFSTPSISADGRFVSFTSHALDLVSGGTILSGHAFVRDRLLGTTELVNVDSAGNEGDQRSVGGTTISADGRYVAFDDPSSNLVPGDTNDRYDCFVRDRVAGTTVRVSVDPAGAEGDGDSRWPFLSSDGQVVTFQSAATNLVFGDGNGCLDAFVHGMAAGTTERVSVGSSGVEGDFDSLPTALSTDGRFVAFQSVATNLVGGDTNQAIDVFVRDRSLGTTERVSVDSTGAEANDSSVTPAISADGRFVAFVSHATNLVVADTNGWQDVYLRDRSGGSTERVSVDSSGTQADLLSVGPQITANGQCVAFASFATNLDAGDVNHQWDAFVRDRAVARWSNYGAGFPGTNGVPAFTSQANPVLGTTLTLDLANSYRQPTVGILFAGFAQTTIPTNRGGDLLVAPWIVLPISFSFGGDSFAWGIPSDFRLAGLVLDLQALEVDPGAAKGVSFTAGLELTLGS